MEKELKNKKAAIIEEDILKMLEGFKKAFEKAAGNAKLAEEIVDAGFEPAMRRNLDDEEYERIYEAAVDGDQKAVQEYEDLFLCVVEEIAPSIAMILRKLLAKAESEKEKVAIFWAFITNLAIDFFRYERLLTRLMQSPPSIIDFREEYVVQDEHLPNDDILVVLEGGKNRPAVKFIEETSSDEIAQEPAEMLVILSRAEEIYALAAEDIFQVSTP